MRARRVVVSAALAAALFAPALALAGPPGGLEVAPGTPDVRPFAPVVADRAPPGRGAAWRDFVTDAGGAWTAWWDPATRAPRRAFGAGVAAPGSVADARAGERIARELVTRHAALLLPPGVSVADLELVANDLDGGLRTVGFAQRARLASGERVPVTGGGLSFRFEHDRMVLLADELAPMPSLPPAVVAKDRAAAAALAWIGAPSGRTAIARGAELVVLPLARHASVDARAAWRVRVEASPLVWDVYVDAASGRALAREPLLRFGTGTERFDAPVREPDGDRLPFLARRATVKVDGTAAQTTVDGLFAWSGGADASVDAAATGPDAAVLNQSGPPASATFSVADGGDLVWSLADDEMGDAQLSAFIHIGIAKTRARAIAPTMSWLKQTLEVTTNGTDPQFTCNAYWDGMRVNFFREMGPCNNTSRLADVVYHEFGHGFHQHAVISGVGATDASLGEGQSDYFAATITDDPIIAPGFLLGGGYLREIDSDKRWPDDIDGDPHETGRIYSGAMWDLRTALVAELGQDAGVALADHLDYMALRRATDIPTTYPEMLAADDDDGDLANGTPHVCEITAAFSAHGLAQALNAAGLVLEHDALANVPPGNDPIPLRLHAHVTYPQCQGDAIQSVRVTWHTLGGLVGDVQLSPDGDDWVGSIPGQSNGTPLGYRVRPVVAGHELSLPDNRADDEYRAFVGNVRPLYCNDFESDISGWTFGDDKGTAGDYEWGSLAGLGGDPGAAFSGDRVIGDDLDHDGRYTGNRDTFAISPVIDLAGEQHVRLQFRRWLDVEDGVYDKATIRVNDKQVFANPETAPEDGSLTFADHEWRFEDIDLSPIAQQTTTVQVRFGIDADTAYQLGGWTIDDLCVVAWTPPGSTFKSDGDGDVAVDGTRLEDLDAAGGCACTSGGAPAPGGGLAALAVVALLALRRRRSA